MIQKLEYFNLRTIFSSNFPLACHILKGRLETEGLECFIFDEFVITVHPFYAALVGGVKLKVPSDQFEYGNKIINNLQNNKLTDSDSDYDCKIVFENEFQHQNEILNLKNLIRNDSSLLTNSEVLKMYIKNDWITDTELNNIISEETEFFNLSKKSGNTNWRNVLNDFFEYGLNIFDKIRSKPVNYFLEKETVDNYCKADSNLYKEHCPYCYSKNIRFANAMDYKWDILFLIFSILIRFPFPIVRAKYHCFDCGYDFKKKDISQ